MSTKISSIGMLRVGQPLHNGYADYRVEAVGYDWFVVRSRDNDNEVELMFACDLTLLEFGETHEH